MVSDLRKEMRAAAFKGELLNAMFPRMILFLIIIILWYIIEPYGIQLSLYAWLCVFSFFVVILMWNAKKRTNSIMIKIDEIIDGRMDATELLEKYEGGDFPVFSSLFNKYTNDELELEWQINNPSFDTLHGIDVSSDGQNIYVSARGNGYMHIFNNQGGPLRFININAEGVLDDLKQLYLDAKR